jgi:hypothetical protein
MLQIQGLEMSIDGSTESNVRSFEGFLLLIHIIQPSSTNKIADAIKFDNCKFENCHFTVTATK